MELENHKELFTSGPMWSWSRAWSKTIVTAVNYAYKEPPYKELLIIRILFSFPNR